MANTRYLRTVVEEYVRTELGKEFGQTFGSNFLKLTTGGKHEFDAVSADRSIVAGVKTASGLTATGRNPAGKIKDAISELYFLSLVDAPTRLLILTTPTFHAIFLKSMGGKIAPGLQVRCLPLPINIQTEVDHVVADASKEVSPSVARQAVATQIESHET